MTRITKEIALQVATQMTVKKKEAVDKIKKQISEIGYIIAKQNIPKEVLTMYEKHKKYFNTSSTINVVGVGLDHYYIDFNENLPNKDGWRTTIQVGDKVAEKIVKLNNQLQDKGKDYKDLHNEIERAIYNLRTYAKVEDQFPEAFPFLPSQQTTAIAINIDSIRKKL